MIIYDVYKLHNLSVQERFTERAEILDHFEDVSPFLYPFTNDSRGNTWFEWRINTGLLSLTGKKHRRPDTYSVVLKYTEPFRQSGQRVFDFIELFIDYFHYQYMGVLDEARLNPPVLLTA